jgi:hypothetical protein
MSDLMTGSGVQLLLLLLLLLLCLSRWQPAQGRQSRGLWPSSSQQMF